jgi:hypothetical protein
MTTSKPIAGHAAPAEPFVRDTEDIVPDSDS